MFFRDNKGIALIIALFVIVVLLILGGVFILRSVGESYTARNEKLSIQAFFLGEAGVNSGLNRLDILINTDMLTTVNDTNSQKLVNDVTHYVSSRDGIEFLIKYTKENGQEQFIPAPGDSAAYTINPTALGNGTYAYTIAVTEKSDPVLVAEDVWDFPYNYSITSIGNAQAMRRKVILRGDFTVRVQRDNFARYALFTDHHSLPSGGTVWFNNMTHFYGPIHTNEHFSFAFNPTFDGLVTQHKNDACFLHNGCIDADSFPPLDVPVLNAGFNRGVDEINLESSIQKEDLQEQAWGGTPGTPPPGIYVPNDGANLTAGIYVRGDSTINMDAVGGNAVYTITQGSTTKIITVDYGEEVIGDEHTTVQTVGGSTNIFNGLPDGIDDVGTIIYVDGAVNSLGGTVQKQSQVTISSEKDIVVTDNIFYEEFTPGQGTPGQPGYVPPNAEGTTNLLGILSWGGYVRIGSSAPNNVNIHGTVMARNGIFTVDNYTSPPPRGAATLLGGVITQFYGAFGTFNSQTGQQISGYGRNFVYDGRMAEGASPPYFPSMRTFIAFTNDITDKITWQEGGF